jgi:hypothetical protein
MISGRCRGGYVKWIIKKDIQLRGTGKLGKIITVGSDTAAMIVVKV